MTEQTSMLGYLADLTKYGHRPIAIGTVRIGRTVYAAGTFLTPETDPPAGSRAAAEGRVTPSEVRIALIPAYRTDWVTHDSAGPTPSLFPASYAHRQRTVYRQHTTDGDRYWYVSGWNEGSNVLWLNDASWMADTYPPDRIVDRPVQTIHFESFQSFDSCVRMAGDEVWVTIEPTLRPAVRKTAAEWHGGQTSALCSFATTGAVNGDELIGEIRSEIESLADRKAPDYDTLSLFLLWAYVSQADERGPMVGWSDVHF